MVGRSGTPAWAVMLAGLILAWPAFWNGYPLVFADTGTYLGQVIQLYLGWDRPPHYSLFLHALHWRLSLWPIPIAQGLIVAHLLGLVLRVLGRPGGGPLLGVCAALALATGLPWFAAQVMPDVFTGVVVLCLWLLGFQWDRLGRAERAYLVLLTAGAIAVHLAHLPMALGLVLSGGAIAWIAQGRRAATAGAGRMAMPVALAVLALLLANLVGHQRFSVSPFGSVFVAARLMEDGPAMRTLDARCADASWAVCGLRERLPMPANDFLWLPEGPLRGELGGGKAWAAEASAIVGETLRREPLVVARIGLRNALRQLTLFGTGDGLTPWRDLPGPEPLIEAYFPRELPAYRTSLQSAGALAGDAAALSRLHMPLALLGLLSLPLIAWRWWRHEALGALAVLTLLAAIGNAILTGALSGPHERYQGRIAWLFVLAPLAVLMASRATRRVPGAAEGGPVPVQAGAIRRRQHMVGAGRNPGDGMPHIEGGTMSGLMDVALEARQVSALQDHAPALVPLTRLVAARQSIAARYQASGPLAHVVLDNLFDGRVLNSLAVAREGAGRGPELSQIGTLFLHQLASEPFVAWLTEVTGIEELVADPDMRDSGLREARAGSVLDLRIGAARHSRLPLIRRLVLVVYVERGWDAGWGGTLDLCAPGSAAAEPVVPRFNRAVLLQTLPAGAETRQDVLRCPSSAACRALSVTYWSPDPEARGAPASTAAAPRMGLGALARSVAGSLVGQVRAAMGRDG